MSGRLQCAALFYWLGPRRPCHELNTGDAGQQAAAKFHIEQPGRMKGMVRRHCEEFPIDYLSMRDTSYGAREYGRREILDYGQFGPSRVRFEATDKLGRSLTATGTIAPGLVFTGYTDHTAVWSLSEWDWDGVTHWGDN